MKTRQGIRYWTQGGRYTTDGYDFFSTLSELEDEIDWQIAWSMGKAKKTPDGRAERHTTNGGIIMNKKTMQIIISTGIRFTTEEDVNAYKALSFEALPMTDLEFNEATRYLIGWRRIVLFGLNGHRLAVLDREQVRGMAVDGKPVTVSGEDFTPIDSEKEELLALREQLRQAGRYEHKSDLMEYMKINKSGLPVVAVDGVTEVVKGTFNSMTDLLLAYPTATITIVDDEQPTEGHWTVGVMETDTADADDEQPTENTD